MKVQAISTRKVTAKACTIFDLLDESLSDMPERSVLVVTSKVVSLCEGRVSPLKGTDLPALVRQEAEWYMPQAKAQHGYTFTIAHNLLTPNSGIDESNADDQLVRWPADPQASTNAIRQHLRERFGLREIAVIIADSTFLPLRWGAVSLSLAYSGIEQIRSYKDRVDLFGRPLALTRTNVTDGLAVAAGLVMGEGAEQTPLVLITDIPHVRFVAKDPTPTEIARRRALLSEDSFAPLLMGVKWTPGGAQKSQRPDAEGLAPGA